MIGIKWLIKKLLPFYLSYYRFSKARLQSNYFDFLKFKLGFNKRYWPAHKNCTIAHSDKIFVGINSLVGRNGNYLQGAGTIYIGDYVQLAQNVGILSVNHDLYDQNKYVKKPVIIRDYCWVGMNSVLLPGVELGTRTVVAAGSIVTKSFPEGYCVIGGNPAKLIKTLDKQNFKPWYYEEAFYGYIHRDTFKKSKYWQKLSSHFNLDNSLE